MKMLRLASAAVVLAACMDQQAMIAKLTPPEIDRFSRDYMALVARGQRDSAAALLIPSADRAEESKVFPELSRIMKRGFLDSARIVNVNVSTTKLFASSSTRRTNLIYQMPADSGWLVVNIVTIDSGSVARVERFDLEENAIPFGEPHKPDLEKHGTGDVIVLAVFASNVILSVIAFFVLLFARRMPKRKRWMVASLFGVGKFSWDSTIGFAGFSPLSIQLFGAGVTQKGAGSPTVLSVSIPLGALAALWQFHRWLNPPPVVPDDTAIPEPAPVVSPPASGPS